MAMFCTKCGTPNAEGSVFCGGCGASLTAAPAAQPQQPQYQAPAQPVYQAPQQPQYQAPQPQYQQPVYQAPQQPVSQAAPKASKVNDAVKKNFKAIVVLVLIVSLVSGAMHLFGWHHQEVGFQMDIPTEQMMDVPSSAMAGLSILQNMEGKLFIAMPMADLRDMVDSMKQTMEMSGMDFDEGIDEAEEQVPGLKDCVNKITMFGISSYVLGGTGIVTALLLLYVLSLVGKNAPGSRKFFSIAAIVGALGSVAALVLALMGSNPSISSEGITVGLILNVHMTHYICAIAGVVLLYADKVALKGDNTVLK